MLVECSSVIYFLRFSGNDYERVEALIRFLIVFAFANHTLTRFINLFYNVVIEYFTSIDKSCGLKFNLKLL